MTSKTDTHAATIERLRAERRESDQAFAAQGKALGRRWVQQASYVDLVALESAWETGTIEVFVQTPLATQVYRVLDPEQHSPDVWSWWGDFANPLELPLICRRFFVEGFIDGALELWDEIRDPVEQGAPTS